MFVEKGHLFQGMSPEFMAEIGSNLIPEVHTEGDVLFNAGDPADFLYVLEDGRVRLSAGERGIVTRIVEKEGDALGWSSLVGRESYSSSAECLTDARVVKIRKDVLNEIFNRHPACGMLLFRRLARLIGERLLENYHQISADHEGKGTHGYSYSG
jgi:CRP-like cAMP-binding protein